MRGSRAVAAVAMGACAACVALVVRAEADEARVALTWNAPRTCPDEASVRASIGQLLLGSTAVVEGHAEVRETGDRWQVVVTMNGGERRLVAASCRALADATALIVAMAVNPERAAANRIAGDAGPFRDSPSTDAFMPTDVPLDAGLSDALFAEPVDAPPAPNVQPSSPPVVSPVPTAPPASSPLPTAPPTSTRVAVSASAALDLGSLPSAALGPSLGLAWTPSQLRLELQAAYFPSSTLGVPGVPGPSVQFSLLAVALRGCYQARLGSFELGPCAGVEGGLLHESPQGFNGTGAIAMTETAPLFAFDAGLLGAWRFSSSWAFFARGDALLQTFRPEFTVFSLNLTPLYTPAVVTGRASLGFELRF